MITGVALVALFAAARSLPLHGEEAEWAAYLTLLPIFPAVVCAALVWRRLPPRDAVTGLLIVAARVALGVVTVVACLALWIRGGPVTGAVTAAFSALAVWFAYRRGLVVGATGTARLASATLIMIASLGVWSAAMTLLHVTPFDTLIRTSKTRALVFLAAAWLSYHFLATRGRSSDVGRDWRIVHAAAFVSFLVVAFRNDDLFEYTAFAHWTFWTGPIEAVRQGGWLLWDVPSQYGFLSILVPAAVPVASAWQALYLAQGVLLVLLASFLFALLRRLASGALADWFALAVTIAAVFLMPGWYSLFVGPQAYPSVGPMRFVWCYALLAVLWRDAERDEPSQPGWISAGALVLVLGVLWSAESAVYTTVGYVCAYGVAVIQAIARARATPASPQTARRALLRHVAIPGALLLGVMSAIGSYYLLVLGVSPDWAGYYEYALAYRGGFGAIAIKPWGVVWVLFTVLAALGTAATGLALRAPLDRRLPLVMGAFGIVWATSSYFVSRSHPNAVNNLIPMLLAALTVALVALSRPPTGASASVLRVLCAPIIAITLAASAIYTKPMAFVTAKPRAHLDVDIRLPRADAGLIELIARAGIRPTDPVAFVDMDSRRGSFLMPAWRALGRGPLETNRISWLPKPLLMVEILPDARGREYVRRFAEHMRLGGWMVVRRDVHKCRLSAWRALRAALAESYVPRKRFANAMWRAVWYEPRLPGDAR